MLKLNKINLHVYTKYMKSNYNAENYQSSTGNFWSIFHFCLLAFMATTSNFLQVALPLTKWHYSPETKHGMVVM
jgi:hypothetical protein